MTCAEFQAVLPYIIESGGNPEEEAHLRSCPVCADLVADLKYIADQAKLLVPMEEPSPRVWQGIQKTLSSERPQPRRARTSQRFGAAARTSALTALVVLAVIALVRRHAEENRPTPPATTASVPSLDADDQKLLDQVAARSPSLRETYQNALEEIESYIRDAKGRLQQDPGDELARLHLLRAYEQKAAIYQTALANAAE